MGKLKNIGIKIDNVVNNIGDRFTATQKMVIIIAVFLIVYTIGYLIKNSR